MINKDKKILFLGAHKDDVEFGCGGLISSLIRSDFVKSSIGFFSVSGMKFPPNFPPYMKFLSC